MPNEQKAGPRVELEVAQGDDAWGTLVVELDEESTPITTKNFLKYVEDGFFDGTVFHRIIANFMVQGGGHDTDGKPKRKGLREPIENEAAHGLSHVAGTIAMARTNDPHSATSQFFINVSDNGFLNHPGTDGWGYCAFGRVVEGLDVLERIKAVETKANPEMDGEVSQPTYPLLIKAARRSPG